MRFERDVFLRALAGYGEVHDDAFVVSADLGDSCELGGFRERFPERYVDLGLSEQNAVSWAAGLAREGLRPIVCTFGVFLYRRALDQIEMSVAASGLPVTLVGFVPGISTPRGIAHQAVNDVGVLRTVPGLTILDVGDASEARQALEAARSCDGPVYVRMLRGEVPSFLPADTPYEVGSVRELAAGEDVLLLSSSVCTAEALRAADAIRARGVSLRHVHVPCAKPLDGGLLAELASSCRHGVVTFENHQVTGGLGSTVAEALAEHGVARRLVRLGLRDTYARSGSMPYLMRSFGLDALALVEAVELLAGRPLGVSEGDLLPA